MARIGLCGPSYTSQSRVADDQLLQNMYLEAVESGQGTSAGALYCRPGLKALNAVGDGKGRGIYSVNGRTFAVTGTVFYELKNLSTGVAPTNYALGVQDDGLPVSWADSNTQLVIASGGTAYILDLVSNVFSVITDLVGINVSQVEFCDGFFLATIAGTNQFQISAAGDGSSWDPTDKAAISVFAGNIKAMKCDHRQVFFFGEQRTVPYYDSGNPDFAFDVVPGGIMETGIASRDASCLVDNTIFFWGFDNRSGQMIANRLNGYGPQRISNHGVEYAVQRYTNPLDVETWTFQIDGHTFWMSYFPSQKKTWAYDVATGTWSEWASFILNPFSVPTGNLGAFWARCHTFNFGKHIVLDFNGPLIYEMNIPLQVVSTAVYESGGGGSADQTGGTQWLFADDDGTLIQRIRRSPMVSAERQWIPFAEFELLCDTGLGPQPPLTNDGNTPAADGSNWRGPTVSLRWSDDGCNTWSNFHDIDTGQSGKFDTRVIWRRLGRSRGRIFEVSCSDPVPWRFVDAYVYAPPFFERTERLPHTLRKSA